MRTTAACSLPAPYRVFVWLVKLVIRYCVVHVDPSHYCDRYGAIPHRKARGMRQQHAAHGSAPQIKLQDQTSNRARCQNWSQASGVQVLHHAHDASFGSLPLTRVQPVAAERCCTDQIDLLIKRRSIAAPGLILAQAD